MEPSTLAGAKLLRNQMISSIEWRRTRHKDELELSITTTLTSQEYTDLLNYIQDLRECLDGVEDVEEIVWPTKPSFIDEY